MTKYVIPFLVALLISYITTPLAKKIAYKLGAIDIPKDERRVHKKPIPRLGGLAIYVSTVLSIIIFSFAGYIQMDKSLISILIGGTIIAVTGIIDDTKNLPAKIKLLGQIAAAGVLIWGGIKISFISKPFSGEIINLNYLSIPITIFWIVGITNTLNLIDGLDGLAAGVAGIASISLMFVASTFVDIFPFYTGIILISAILAGAAFGFLPYNFNPAKIFMGDTGALFLGFMLAVISVKGVMKSFTTISVVLPVIILGIPIFDTAFAILRRFINRRPIMQADKGHLHHRLLDKGLSQKQTVLVLYFIGMALGGLALVLTGMNVEKSTFVLGMITGGILLLIIQMSLVDLIKQKSGRN
ncbi:MraY family glycosyltransferase [Abyssisolibacter fermentans]|uniref:MraY family glycosyltransferase n=1 Tax=Abyssisolibacter fermentans TaxID=1766203 RepID=UPI000832292F|nr:MraY family glycosyltransferase [Abyssisolibacter fermentans]